MITYDDFKKLELRVARIKEVREHPNADRLYVLVIELEEGRTKQIVAGIRKSYTKEELVGKQIVVVDNLEPAMLRGEESQGMLLAASDETGIAILTPQREVKLGSVVK
ncbi:MAG: methionine--tRNA ligase subunit beta [Deltaproteobacteria bacterium]